MPKKEEEDLQASFDEFMRKMEEDFPPSPEIEKVMRQLREIDLYLNPPPPPPAYITTTDGTG